MDRKYETKQSGRRFYLEVTEVRPHNEHRPAIKIKSILGLKYNYGRPIISMDCVNREYHNTNVVRGANNVSLELTMDEVISIRDVLNNIINYHSKQ
jgi:hypothetical protein